MLDRRLPDKPRVNILLRASEVGSPTNHPGSNSSIILPYYLQFDSFSSKPLAFKCSRSPKMILIRCYAQILRSRSLIGYGVQKM